MNITKTSDEAGSKNWLKERAAISAAHRRQKTDPAVARLIEKAHTLHKERTQRHLQDDQEYEETNYETSSASAILEDDEELDIDEIVKAPPPAEVIVKVAPKPSADEKAGEGHARESTEDVVRNLAEFLDQGLTTKGPLELSFDLKPEDLVKNINEEGDDEDDQDEEENDESGENDKDGEGYENDGKDGEYDEDDEAVDENIGGKEVTKQKDKPVATDPQNAKETMQDMNNHEMPKNIDDAADPEKTERTAHDHVEGEDMNNNAIPKNVNDATDPENAEETAHNHVKDEDMKNHATQKNIHGATDPEFVEEATQDHGKGEDLNNHTMSPKPENEDAASN